MSLKIEKLSILLVIYGIAAIAVLFGLSAFGFLPFELNVGTINAIFLLILAAFLVAETFKEGKIKSLNTLTRNPIASLELLLIVVTVMMAFFAASYTVIPETMQGLIGLLYIILAVMVIVETRS